MHSKIQIKYNSFIFFIKNLQIKLVLGIKPPIRKKRLNHEKMDSDNSTFCE